MQSIIHKMTNFFIALLWAIASGCVFSGCSNCSILNASGPFNGFSLSSKKTQIIQKSGGSIGFETSEAGNILIEIPKSTYSSAQQVDVRSEKSTDLDEEFKSHPYTTGLKKLDGALKLVLGKTPPTHPAQVCFERSRVFNANPSEEIIPLVYWYYDGDGETLSQFTKPDQVSKDKRECLLIEPSQFSELDNADGRFEAVIVFAKKDQSR